MRDPSNRGSGAGAGFGSSSLSNRSHFRPSAPQIQEKYSPQLELFCGIGSAGFSVPTCEEIEAAKTPAGGWMRKQLAAWGVEWPPPKGWRKRLLAQGKAGAA
jgi:hypothetical protein